ncbi:acetyl-CoA carboxylase family protein [Sphingomonas immobilis]|uniref:Carboxyl transferase domain-containing protein n=1 Tax=Sphingomonas immobilis TaxID=3063997 RepID=A0ABT8ZZX8_9SPHN|nr:carboxyl transferase domain-containing protein [Sphingomonas sp. CA1-15]MDO7843128.1 carboxyl transferase domain-containing protein [Sphingomonas sp. CA1-15]
MFRRLLIANRGEIAIRIARAAASLGIETLAIYPQDDAASLHVRIADASAVLPGRGVAAYLDGDALIAAAVAAGCDAVHPGYGFLAENVAFAESCAAAGPRFIGPDADHIRLFGDKASARAYAQRLGVPLLPGTQAATSLEEAEAFARGPAAGRPVMLKALAGGGGRGMRVVSSPDQIAEAFERCRSEAQAAFGDGALYVEQLVERARHVEVQVIGDGSGAVSHLHERDCTLQRRNQKLVEIAPSPGLPDATRQRLCAAAVAMASECRYSGLGTFEFLVDADRLDDFWFMEVNPRVQVEHTVTEEITGIDLVQAQIRVASGASLASLGLEQSAIPAPRGFAIQLRINMETTDETGAPRPSGGTISTYELPSGPGVRTDGFGYAGYPANASYDPLLVKLIVSATSRRTMDDYRALLTKAGRAAAETRIDGVATNLALLRVLVGDPAVRADAITTRFIEGHAADLVAAAAAIGPGVLPVADTGATPGTRTRAEVPPGMVAIRAHSVGTIVAIGIEAGDVVRRGQQIAILEAMKMEHPVLSDVDGIVREIGSEIGATVSEGDILLAVEPAELEDAVEAIEAETDLDAIGPALAETIARHAVGLDENRPEAVGKRHAKGKRTVRENIADLLDADSLIEYGALALAAQRRRRSLDELIRISPADGLVAGVGTVNAALFEERAAQCMVMGYDYTVFAGTQGGMNHKKMDRLLGIAREQLLPVISFTEGGGGRPGDTDKMRVAGLEETSFTEFARLSGKVPLIGVTSGRCFAGNAALLGCCDVIIATANANIGMGGPAMIEGGGLGVFTPEQVGPMSVQVANGVVDIPVADEVAAVVAARQYLSYFQGTLTDWSAADQRALRHIIPENRLRVYDVRRVIETLADTGSVLELRRAFGPGIITALIRIEGRPVALIANDPQILSGAIDSDAADKGARFLQLADTHGLPVLSLCDTPGFMVGPESETSAAVRHMSRLFLAGANMSEPMMTVVLRKAYGLGAMAMSGGSSLQTLFTVSWPQGEFGGMGLEGSVRLGYRKELEAIGDPAARETKFQEMVAELYQQGKAINAASYCEIDDVIDPAATRRWILSSLRSRPPRPHRPRRYVDAW